MSRQIKVSRARYSGDPGLFGFLGKVAKGALSIGTGVVTGHPLAGVQGAIQSFTGGGGTGAGCGPGYYMAKSGPKAGTCVPNASTRASLQGATKFSGIKIGGGTLPGGIKLPSFTGGTTVAYGSPSPVSAGGGGGVPAGMKLACPSGFHPNKSGYYTHSEGWIPEGSKCVRNRRRNPANPRALDRAIGRLEGAKRLQHKLAGFSTPNYTAGGKRKD